MDLVLHENHQGITIAAVEATVAFLATIVICLRIWARKLKGARLDASDWTCIAGLCVALGLFAFNVWSVTMGLGLPPPAPKPGQNPYAVPPSPIRTYGTIMIDIYLWTTSNSLVRISAALLYLRLFPNRSIRIFCWIFIVLNVAYILGTYIAIVLLCYPLEKGWMNKLPPPRCNHNRQRLFLGHGIINLLFDVTVVVLPMPCLWKIQLPTRQKLPLLGVFAIGLGVCGIMIVRTYELQTLSVQKINANPLLVHLLTTPEPFLGIICVSLPVLRPVARKVKASFSRASKSSSKESSENGDIPTIGRRRRIAQRVDPHAIDINELFPSNSQKSHSRENSTSKKGSLDFGLPPVAQSATATRWELETSHQLGYQTWILAEK